MPRPFQCRGLVCKPFALGRVSSERRYASTLTRSVMIVACDPLRSAGVYRGCRGLGCRGLLSKRITRHGGGLRTRAVLFNCRPESTSPPRREAALGSADLGNMNPRHCPLVCCLSRHLPLRRDHLLLLARIGAYDEVTSGASIAIAAIARFYVRLGACVPQFPCFDSILDAIFTHICAVSGEVITRVSAISTGVVITLVSAISPLNAIEFLAVLPW